MISISLVGRVLRRLVQVSCRGPWLTIACSLLLGLLGVGYALHALTFKTSALSLLPAQAGYVLRYEEYAREFGELQDIVVVVEAGSFEGARAYATRLTEELRASAVPFRRIAYRIDPKRFEGRQLLYLSTAQLQAIRDKIFDYQDFIESFAGDPTLARLVEGINTQLAASFVSNLFDLGLQKQEAPDDVHFLRVLLDQMTGRLRQPSPYQSPWGTLFAFGENEPADTGYFLSEDKSLLFILIETPAGDQGSFVGDQRAIEVIRGTIAHLRSAFPTVQAGVTGDPALSNDEMVASFHDSQWASVLAFVLTLLVMTVAFARVGKPLLILGVLVVTLAWSIGAVTLVVGHLTLFSVLFISIVIGIGTDYGIYVLFRYEEEIFLGRNLRDAIERTAARSGPGTLLAALAAAGTFFVLMLTSFRGIQELGFVAGLSILLAWLGMMTLLPACLVVLDRRHGVRPRDHTPAEHQLARIRVPLLDRIAGYPRTVLAVAVIVTALSLGAVPFVGFDYNLLNLQARGTESVMWQKRVFAATGRSGFNGLSSAVSLDDLRRKQEAFERLPSVADVDSVLRVIPDDQKEKVAIVKSFAPIIAGVRIGRPDRVDVGRLQKALTDIKRRFDIVAVEAGDSLPAEVRLVRQKVTALLGLLDSANRDSVQAAIDYLQAQLYRDFVSKFYRLQSNLNPTPITLADIPEDLRQKFVGNHGHLLLEIHPKVDIWDRQGATQFVEDLRSVDPDVTGPPVITYEATRLMERAYRQGAVYAFILVGGLSLLMLRRIRETLLTMLPLALGLLWTLGLMRAFGVPFNLANIWGLPIIIGTSAEFGLNVVLRYLEGHTQGGPLVARSTVLGVALSGIQTMVGFGSLMIATHRGIFTLGLLLTLGMASSLVAALVVLPVVLRLVRRAPAHLGADVATTKRTSEALD